MRAARLSTLADQVGACTAVLIPLFRRLLGSRACGRTLARRRHDGPPRAKPISVECGFMPLDPMLAGSKPASEGCHRMPEKSGMDAALSAGRTVGAAVCLQAGHRGRCRQYQQGKVAPPFRFRIASERPVKAAASTILAKNRQRAASTAWASPPSMRRSQSIIRCSGR
jgi:hypothetical protein